MRALLISIVFTVLGQLGIAQAEFRHMHYNLTLYGNPWGCDESNNNTDDKDGYLQEIISYAQPDILTVNELRDGNYWADRILDDVLNEGQSNWARAPLTGQFTFSSILNGLYYRSDKFVLHSQHVIHEDLNGGNLVRPIDVYGLYLIHPDLVLGDTLFLNLAVAHLSASDATERYDQTEAFMDWLQEQGPGNFIFTGDLNMDDAFEGAFQNLISPSDAQLAFQDPISTSSFWHNNSSVSSYHTQSTRYNNTNGGCFSGGGLDDRFDITLISQGIEQGSAGISYVTDSYEVLGQSGADYNQALQTNNNLVVPDVVAQALYEMSDHLPVITEYSYELLTSMAEEDALNNLNVLPKSGGWSLVNPRGILLELRLFDLSGRAIWTGQSAELEIEIPGPFASGVYFLNLKNDRSQEVRVLPYLR